jgi:septal ring factor EnvC (AmiA/AmiB activator)
MPVALLAKRRPIRADQSTPRTVIYWRSLLRERPPGIASLSSQPHPLSKTRYWGWEERNSNQSKREEVEEKKKKKKKKTMKEKEKEKKKGKEKRKSKEDNGERYKKTATRRR